MRPSFLFRVTSTIFLIISCTLTLLIYSSNRIYEVYDEIQSVYIKNYVSNCLNNVVFSSINKNDFETSFIKENEENYKEFDYIYLKELLNNVSKNAYEELTNSSFDNENLKMKVDIPLSVIYNLPLISTLGSRLPVYFHIVGNLLLDIDNCISEFGINNCLMEIILNIDFELLIYLPLLSKKEKIHLDFPLYSSIIQGSIPSFAFGSYDLVNTIINENGEIL